MAKAKKSKPRDRIVRWWVSLIKGTPAKFIDCVQGPDATSAEDIAAKEHKIPDTLRDRVVAVREDWWNTDAFLQENTPTALPWNCHRPSPVTFNEERTCMRSDAREISKARIKKLRDRANEIRGAAAKISNRRVRASMINIAKSYDNTADLLERIMDRGE
jgi:hypothetical protein